MGQWKPKLRKSTRTRNTCFQVYLVLKQSIAILRKSKEDERNDYSKHQKIAFQPLRLGADAGLLFMLLKAKARLRANNILFIKMCLYKTGTGIAPIPFPLLQNYAKHCKDTKQNLQIHNTGVTLHNWASSAITLLASGTAIAKALQKAGKHYTQAIISPQKITVFA